jgi:hypothetical protein
VLRTLSEEEEEDKDNTEEGDVNEKEVCTGGRGR